MRTPSFRSDGFRGSLVAALAGLASPSAQIATGNDTTGIALVAGQGPALTRP